MVAESVTMCQIEQGTSAMVCKAMANIHISSVSTALVITSVELLRQVRPDSDIAQSRHPASSSDCQLTGKLCDDL